MPIFGAVTTSMQEAIQRKAWDYLINDKEKKNDYKRKSTIVLPDQKKKFVAYLNGGINESQRIKEPKLNQVI